MKAQASLFIHAKDKPLAERLRPMTLNDVVGQNHLLSQDAPIGRMLAAGHLSSLILWGPPGCGKTTIARLLSQSVGSYFEPVSAVASGVADLRKIFEQADIRQASGTSTLLFVDEIHRFNRSQQDVLLPFVEEGRVTLVGATTENPSFELNGALLSRCQVFTLASLDAGALSEILDRCEVLERKKLPLSPESRSFLIGLADGDGRYLIGLAEALFRIDGNDVLDEQRLSAFVQKRRPLYDKSQDGHYNLISAFHKSMRGSDCDAALYWFSRMLDGGEDARYIARRMIRFASEDVGMADPHALSIALNALQAYERLGSPEGELAVAQAVIYLATAPKSNAAYTAYKAARGASSQFGSLMPPKHILNAPTKMMKEHGYGDGYAYDHDAVDAFSGQNYFPESMTRQTFYVPFERGFERDIRKRLDYWAALRARKQAR